MTTRAPAVALRDLVSLAKPRVTSLVLVTCGGGMWLAPGHLGTGRALLTLVGTALAVAAANSLNCWLERDTDGLMARTRHRPLPAGRLAPRVALTFGLALSVLSLPLMALNYALTHQLIGWHGHRAYAAICAAALAANLLLNWRLIPAIGMRGAAWSTLWTELVLTLGCLAALRAAKGPRPVAAPAAGLRLEVES